MRYAFTFSAAVIALTLLTPSTLVGWGHEGHEIVASLAQTRLTENAKRGIGSLLGDASLASIANWADEVRPDRDETYNWHFVDIPKDASGFSDERDCFLPNSRHKGSATDHHNCVVDRIEMFKQVLSDSNASRTTASKPSSSSSTLSAMCISRCTPSGRRRAGTELPSRSSVQHSAGGVPATYMELGTPDSLSTLAWYEMHTPTTLRN
jgi:hypothetical protein